MLYTRRSFTVPASTAKGEMCREKGHSAADGKGRCFCCGEQIVKVVPPLPPEAERIAAELEADAKAAQRIALR